MHGDVDFDRAWLKLKAVIAEKRSHGQEALLAEMARIELDCAEQGVLEDSGPPAHEGPLPNEAASGPSGDMSRPANPLDAQGGNYVQQHRRPAKVG